MKIRTIIIAIVVIAVAAFVAAPLLSQSQPKRYVVKLYSGDKMVGTWEAFDFGRLDGQTLVIAYGDRKFPTRLRISGTFSVEEFD